ncbi:TetR family transcriptional regulator C-terminal domain-containing protein [Streptomyces sp. NPDC060209]|uniref:TetR family transcriptional regulator C-terminal domain-containing protein n=1 Tax=Streptomyces sp. NPDC060209 TaxID=3347073 RepID=UPI003668FC10
MLPGEVRRDLDPELEARTLLALADGLTVHVLAGHHTSAAAPAILKHHIGHLLEGPPA